MGLRQVLRGLTPRFVTDARTRSALKRSALRLAASAAHTNTPGDLWSLLHHHPEFLPLQRRPEMLELLRRLRALAPRRIGEIGTASGGTAFLLIHSAPPGSHLVTLDLATRPGQPEALHLLAGDRRTVSPLIGDSHRPETRDRFAAAAGGPLDFLLIDGDHRYEGVKQDFESFRHTVRQGGLVGFHDIMPDSRSRGGLDTGTSSGGVPTFWTELVAQFPGQTEEIIQRPDQDGCGIGLLHLP